jgi:hypothetical protein
VADQTWLGPERFDKVCVARAEGMKERQFMKEVFAFSTSDLRGRRAGITKRFKEMMAIPEVKNYVDALREEDIEPWTETLYRLRADAGFEVR